MCTSDIRASKKAQKTTFAYLLVSITCVLVGAVYESFSHGVYSLNMVYAFVFPLIGGALPFVMIGLYRPKWYPGIVIRNVHHSGIATLTIGSIMQGVLDIYGTTNSLIQLYWYVGASLVFGGLLVFARRMNWVNYFRAHIAPKSR